MKDEKIDNEINSLVNQLKDSNSNNKQLQHPDSNVPLTPEEVEAFVVQNSAKLITHGLEVMDNVKDYIIASNDPESISALSDLIRASSSSIDTLNKLVVQNKRTATTLTAKQNACSLLLVVVEAVCNVCTRSLR